jgi:hypothetical protein
MPAAMSFCEPRVTPACSAPHCRRSELVGLLLPGVCSLAGKTTMPSFCLASFIVIGAARVGGRGRGGDGGRGGGRGLGRRGLSDAIATRARSRRRSRRPTRCRMRAPSSYSAGGVLNRGRQSGTVRCAFQGKAARAADCTTYD